MLYFLQASCSACLQELKVLDRVRNRYRDRVGLVTVFHDDDEKSAVGSFLSEAGVTPDHVLSDPRFSQRHVYGVEAIPLLLVVGPDGKIVFSRKGFEPADAWALAGDLDGIFLESPPLPPSTSFSEARRIHGEAHQFLKDGRTELAAQYWERALELFPTASALYFHLADAYRSLGRKHDAARAYSRYLSEHPRAYDLGSVKAGLQSLVNPAP